MLEISIIKEISITRLHERYVFSSFSSIHVHFLTQALRIKIRYYPGDRSSFETYLKHTYFERLHRNCCYAESQSKKLETPSSLTFRIFTSPAPLSRISPQIAIFAGTLASAPQMVNAAVSVSVSVLWKPKWTK